MKQLGYGKHYSYNPDFAHPVLNVSDTNFTKTRGKPDPLQEYLPFNLAYRSSFSNSPDEHILKIPEAEQREKEWDEDRLTEWEAGMQGGRKWEGRAKRADIPHKGAAGFGAS